MRPCTAVVASPVLRSSLGITVVPESAYGRTGPLQVLLVWPGWITRSPTPRVCQALAPPSVVMTE